MIERINPDLQRLRQQAEKEAYAAKPFKDMAINARAFPDVAAELEKLAHFASLQVQLPPEVDVVYEKALNTDFVHVTQAAIGVYLGLYGEPLLADSLDRERPDERTGVRLFHWTQTDLLLPGRFEDIYAMLGVERKTERAIMFPDPYSTQELYIPAKAYNTNMGLTVVDFVSTDMNDDEWRELYAGKFTGVY
jgi:hypothetical protein